MRVGIAGVFHESDSFSTEAATLSHFQEGGIRRGDEIIATHVNSHSTIAGHLEGAKQGNFDIVPLFVASAMPMGPLTKDAYETLVGETLDSINNAGPLDGFFLYLHGAMVSEEHPDGDGELCSRVRQLLGPDIPIMITPDIHANMSQKMVDNTTATVIYRMNPHMDTYERGLETASLMARTLKGEINPVQWLEMPPFLINILKQHTREEPCLSLIRETSCQMLWKFPSSLSLLRLLS